MTGRQTGNSSRSRKDQVEQVALFPPIHVSHASIQGSGSGPRAPPRNKMALYESVALPSRRSRAPSIPQMLPTASNVTSASALGSMSLMPGMHSQATQSMQLSSYESRFSYPPYHLMQKQQHHSTLSAPAASPVPRQLHPHTAWGGPSMVATTTSSLEEWRRSVPSGSTGAAGLAQERAPTVSNSSSFGGMASEAEKWAFWAWQQQQNPWGGGGGTGVVSSQGGSSENRSGQKRKRQPSESLPRMGRKKGDDGDAAKVVAVMKEKSRASRHVKDLVEGGGGKKEGVAECQVAQRNRTSKKKSLAQAKHSRADSSNPHGTAAMVRGSRRSGNQQDATAGSFAEDARRDEGSKGVQADELQELQNSLVRVRPGCERAEGTSGNSGDVMRTVLRRRGGEQDEEGNHRRREGGLVEVEMGSISGIRGGEVGPELYEASNDDDNLFEKHADDDAEEAGVTLDAFLGAQSLGRDVYRQSSVMPRDVVTTLGQQKFWKLRKDILRQQRIFSSQLFELHCLQKVQESLWLTLHPSSSAERPSLSKATAEPTETEGRSKRQRKSSDVLGGERVEQKSGGVDGEDRHQKREDRQQKREDRQQKTAEAGSIHHPPSSEQESTMHNTADGCASDARPTPQSHVASLYPASSDHATNPSQHSFYPPYDTSGSNRCKLRTGCGSYAPQAMAAAAMAPWLNQFAMFPGIDASNSASSFSPVLAAMANNPYGSSSFGSHLAAPAFALPLQQQQQQQHQEEEEEEAGAQLGADSQQGGMPSAYGAIYGGMGVGMGMGMGMGVGMGMVAQRSLEMAALEMYFQHQQQQHHQQLQQTQQQMQNPRQSMREVAGSTGFTARSDSSCQEESLQAFNLQTGRNGHQLSSPDDFCNGRLSSSNEGYRGIMSSGEDDPRHLPAGNVALELFPTAPRKASGGHLSTHVKGATPLRPHLLEGLTGASEVRLSLNHDH